MNLRAFLPRLAQSLAVCCILFGTTHLRATDSAGGPGSLVIIGGGDHPKSVMERIVRLAGGTNHARMVIIPLASGEPEAAGDSARTEFLQLGLSRTEILANTGDAGAAQLRSATAVFLTGGDQVRLMKALAGTPVYKELHALLKRDGVISGTSAGAAVMSAVMITGEERGNPASGDSFRSIQREQVITESGFGFLTRVIIDQHFVARRRENRLFSVVLEHPDLVGIGIDEATAVIVRGGSSFEVLGDRTVMIVDARRAGGVRSGPERHLAATDLKVHLLISGDQFNLTTGVLTPAPK